MKFEAREAAQAAVQQVRSLFALLIQKYKYWRRRASGSQFTCFTSKKVQILTPEKQLNNAEVDGRKLLVKFADSDAGVPCVKEDA